MKKITALFLLSALTVILTCGSAAAEEMYTLGDKEFPASVTRLNLNYVSDISVLANCTSLEYLDISYTEVSDITPLAGLGALKVLNLSRLGIEDISVLENLTQLEDLELRDNPIADYSVLRNFPNLKELSVNDTDFAEILPYIDLSSLTTLIASNCAISDLSMLENGTELTALMIHDNPFGNEALSSLSGLSNLERLWIGGTRVDDVSALIPLKKLEYLSLYGSEIESIAGIEALQSLTGLVLSHSGIVDISFMEHLPNLDYIGISRDVRDISALLNLPNLRQVSIAGGENENVPESLWPAYQALRAKGVSVEGLPDAVYDMPSGGEQTGGGDGDEIPAAPESPTIRLSPEDADLSQVPDVIVEGSPSNLGGWRVSNRVAFTFNVEEKGYYLVKLLYSKQEYDGDKADLTINVGQTMAIQSLPPTGNDWSHYVEREVYTSFILAGEATLTIESMDPDGDGYVMNLRSVELFLQADD